MTSWRVAVDARAPQQAGEHAFTKQLAEIMALDPVLVCIGCPWVQGDSFGPRVGSELANADFPLPIYGTLADPWDGTKNLPLLLFYVASKYRGRALLALDASCGLPAEVGQLVLRPSPVYPGAGAGVNRGERVGDYSLLGVSLAVRSAHPNPWAVQREMRCVHGALVAAQVELAVHAIRAAYEASHAQ